MNTLTLQKTPLRQVADVKNLLMNEQARNQLAAVAAKHMNPERMMRVVANAIRTTPKLQQCEPMSFLGALMQCSALGLEPNTILGHAYMIPFDKKEKNKETSKWEVVRTDVQLIIGYKGLIDLARRSGHITSLSANIHYSDDELWDYEEGTEAKLRHRPGPMEGKKLHAYAIAKFKDGGHAYVVLPWSHVLKIRDASQGWQQAVRKDADDVKWGRAKTGTTTTPWGAHEDEMAKKTAIRALSKYLPLSVEFMEAMDVDEAKADYRAFAFDPTAGITIDQADGETIDGEVADEAKPSTDGSATAKSRAEMQKAFQKAQAAKPAKAEPAKPAEAAKEEVAPPVARRPEAADIVDTKSDEPEAEASAATIIDDPVDDDVGEETTSAAEEIDLMAFPTTKQIIIDAADMGAESSRKMHAGSIKIISEQHPTIAAALEAELIKIGG